MDPQTTGIVIGSAIGCAGLIVSVYTTRMSLKHNERLQARKELLTSLHAVASARFHLVTALRELASCATHTKDEHLATAKSLYEDLRLAAQNQCLLRDSEDLVHATRRYRSYILEPVAKGNLTPGVIHGRIRQVTTDFNRVLHRHGDTVGMSHMLFSGEPA